MKIRQLTTAMAVCGLVSTSALAGVPGVVDDPEGPAPQFFQNEEQVMAGAESLLSITAAFITAYGCEVVAEVLTEAGKPFSVKQRALDPQTVDAKFPSNGLDPIELEVTVDATSDFGTLYDVDQTNGEGSIGINSPQGFNLKIRDFDGDLDFSKGGAIMISDALFDLYEYNFWVEWDEHNIKDFWKDQSVDANSDFKDAGLEVITKVGYPLSKWRQYSEHTRWNGIEGDPGYGDMMADKWLITPWGLSEALIEMKANVGAGIGQASLSGTITVLCIDRVPEPERETIGNWYRPNELGPLDGFELTEPEIDVDAAELCDPLDAVVVYETEPDAAECALEADARDADWYRFGELTFSDQNCAIVECEPI